MKRKLFKENYILIINQNGMALMATIILIFIIVSIGLALLTMTNNDTQMSTLQRASNKAFYLADAGIEWAFWKLNSSIINKELDIKSEQSIAEWWSSHQIPPGTATEYYQVTIEDDGVNSENDPKIKIFSKGLLMMVNIHRECEK